jgi:hypothetical protein
MDSILGQGDQACNAPGYTPLRTIWTQRRRDYQDGQFEVSICRSRIHKQAAEGVQRGRRRISGEVDADASAKSFAESVRRSRAAVRDICKSFGADYMLTLTTRENCQDKEHFTKQWKRFRDRISKLQTFQYCATVEPQDRGAYHAHIAVKGRQNLRVIRSIWQSLWGGKGQAAVHIRSPYKEKNLRHKIAAYICKYIGKDFDAQGDSYNKKRYWASRNIVRPEVQWWVVAEGEDSEDEALRIGMRLGIGRERCLMYSSARGVFWMSAGPPDESVGVGVDCPF